MDHPFRTSGRADQVGKAFRVIGRDLRQCLICDGLFTVQGAAAHAERRCNPSQRSLKLAGDTNYTNR